MTDRLAAQTRPGETPPSPGRTGDPAPDPFRDPTGARNEKLRAIAAVFGEAMAARLGAGAPGPGQDAPDPARLAWQTNRLIRHLRDRVEDPGPAVEDRPAAPPPRAAREVPAARPGRRAIPLLVAGEDLGAEHPAVIAHILRGESQALRVSVLRALPGPVARAVIRRLRPAGPAGG
jgi:hypothetical protein